MWPMHFMPYAVIAWSVAAVAGPVLGPIIGGFAAEFAGWRWPILELLFINGFTLLVLLFLLPETYGPTILLRRAQRLRKVTGNKTLRSQSEIDQHELSASAILTEALWRPISLMRDPAVTYANVYIGLVYSVFYMFFESLPLVYEGVYGFSLGITGLVFLSFLVGEFIAALSYGIYLYTYDVPRMKRQFIPEDRLVPALVASFCVPVSLFWFGWTSRASIHWIVPTIGLVFYLPGIWLLFQSLMAYLPSSYPHYQASVLAGNALVRSGMASVFPIFAKAMFVKLGIAGGCSLLAGLSIVFIPPLYFLWRYGAKLRSLSRFAA
jgi:DHA1 family multidrug resistance protein-like MFS transporter